MSLMKEKKMTRVSEIKNDSNENVHVKLVGGPTITLQPHTSLQNADVANISDLRGKVSVKEDLTEVGQSTGKQRLDD